MEPDLRVYEDPDTLAAAAAVEVVQCLATATGQRRSASLVLAGGSTPKGLYHRLAAAHRDDLPWHEVDVDWGDERWVPHGDPRSNYRMARESMLDALPVDPARVHPMPVAGTPAAAASAYERTLRSHVASGWPRFDLVLLGVGADGHTASLFPLAPALDEARRWVTEATAPDEPRVRLTLTLPVITSAATIFLLATGASKAEAIRRAMVDDPDSGCPASLVRHARGRVVWWLDADASARLPSKE
jgi:6-phosphogluconolactonase